ncbi:MAG: GNAT family N-acetyltransferase [Candidatus Izemoplasmatales bacterium]|nr:GNAT family N-acetyltransferase [Candidatus Izemoplasmatales bacterium]
MNYLHLILQSERIQLEPVTIKRDIDVFHHFTAEITRYMFPEPAKSIEGTHEFLERSIQNMASGTEYVFAITNKDTGEFLGMGGVHHLDEEVPEFGIWTKKEAHGHHYGREAIALAYRYFKNQYVAFKYPVDQENVPSKKIPLSMGGTLYRTYEKINMVGVTLHLEEYRIPGEKQ